MAPKILDLYTDYLLSAFGQTTATQLSQLLNGSVSHDQISRFLNGPKQGGKELWKMVKPLVRKIESPSGVLIIDDSIEEKPYTDENDIICWHWDHSKGRSVKGINFVTTLYHNQGMSLPVSIEIVAKTETYVDKKSGKEKRRSPRTKNDMMRSMIRYSVHNQILFDFVLADIWFASAENMMFIHHEMKRHFIFPLKENRKVALSQEEKQAGRYQRVDQLELADNTICLVYLESVDFPLLLAKQVFINEDGSRGVRYLVSDVVDLDFDTLTTIFQKRWKVEEYHHSLKQYASLAKSPTRTVTTQTNHLFASVYAFVKLELLKVKTKLNHRALKMSLYIRALHTAFDELRKLHPSFRFSTA